MVFMSLTNLRPGVIRPIDQPAAVPRGVAPPRGLAAAMRLDFELEERSPMANTLWFRRAVADRGVRRRLVPSAFTLCATTRH